MASRTYQVTRRPGAPARRAGREWPEGVTVEAALSESEAAALADDPGYTLGELAAPAPKPRARKSAG